MIYTDTDFFLAIIKREDWLKTNAHRLYSKYKNQIYTSVATIIELLLLCERYGLDAENVINATYKIAKIKELDREIALLSAYYMKNFKLNVFDAMHAAFCENEIISSDDVFDTIGLKRISLR